LLILFISNSFFHVFYYFCRYEYTPKKIPLFVEKDPKSKEVVPLPLPKIVKESCQHFGIILDPE
jgi:hypothetical protein